MIAISYYVLPTTIPVNNTPFTVFAFPNIIDPEPYQIENLEYASFMLNKNLCSFPRLMVSLTGTTTRFDKDIPQAICHSEQDQSYGRKKNKKYCLLLV